MSAFAFIIGTLAIMFGSQFLSAPLARELARRQGKDPERIFIPVDMGVMGLIGLILGVAMHSPFIGISLSPRGWPGMVAFIAASFVGSHIF